MTDFKDTPDPRHNLPDRRLTDTRKIVTDEGHRVHVSVGFHPHDPTRPREVFCSGGFRSGAQLEFQTQDACVPLSLLLQHGHRPEDIIKSLSRKEAPDGTMHYGSLIGLIADQLE